MFTLKFYRPGGGYEIHQTDTVDVRPCERPTSESPYYQIMFEDTSSNCLVEKLIGRDRFEHYEQLIVENMNGKTSEVIRAE